jgi:flagellar protein FliO/FliZ
MSIVLVLLTVASISLIDTSIFAADQEVKKETEAKTELSSNSEAGAVQETPGAYEPQLKKESDLGTLDLPDSESISFLKSLMALTFVLGLIFMVAYLFKKFTGLKTAGFKGNRVPISMVGHLPLGEKKFLSIVEIQDKHYFIGITPDSVKLLTPLDLDVPKEEPTSKEEGDFENIFQKARQLLNTRGKK